MSAGGAEREAREWYELLKADDPHHCEGYMEAHEDGYRGGAPYTFEQFRNCPMVRFGLQTMQTFAARCANEARLEALEQAAVICEAGEHCRYVDHVQEFCACRTHAAAIRALKAAPLDPPGGQHEN